MDKFLLLGDLIMIELFGELEIDQGFWRKNEFASYRFFVNYNGQKVLCGITDDALDAFYLNGIEVPHEELFINNIVDILLKVNAELIDLETIPENNDGTPIVVIKKPKLEQL